MILQFYNGECQTHIWKHGASSSEFQKIYPVGWTLQNQWETKLCQKWVCSCHLKTGEIAAPKIRRFYQHTFHKKGIPYGCLFVAKIYFYIQWKYIYMQWKIFDI